MKFKNTLRIAMLIALSSSTINSIAQSYNDCGEAPTEPVLVDGSSASMEQLIANSAEVNIFIEQADVFLDCQEALYKKGSLPRSTKEKLTELVKAVTTSRNEIGDNFNEQVAAYRAVNP